jgi:hypothetical protein
MDHTRFVGLDIHKERISVAVAESGRSGAVEYLGEISNDAVAPSRLISALRYFSPTHPWQMNRFFSSSVVSPQGILSSSGSRFIDPDTSNLAPDRYPFTLRRFAPASSGRDSIIMLPPIFPQSRSGRRQIRSRGTVARSQFQRSSEREPARRGRGQQVEDRTGQSLTL